MAGEIPPLVDVIHPNDEQIERGCRLAARVAGRNWADDLDFDENERLGWRQTAKSFLVFMLNKHFILRGI